MKDSALIDFFLTHPCQIYKKGEIILSADMSFFPYLYFLKSGYVRVYALLSNGTEKTYVFYKAGDIFPIIWTFNNINKLLSYKAMDSTVVVHKVPRHKFMDFISTKPDILLEVIHRIIDIHNIYVDRVDSLEYTNSCSRLISCLLFLVKRFGKEDGKNSVVIQIPVTHNDIATSVAMMRETASREIERLIQKGLVATKDHLLVINNVENLKEELENCIERRSQ